MNSVGQSNNSQRTQIPPSSVVDKISNQPSGNVNVGEQKPTVDSNTQKISKTSILLVEDDPILSRMYGEKFKNEGFEVFTAMDGEAGLDMALTKKLDMVLLDIMLPKMSGTDLLTKLRQDPKGKNIPVVVLTNLAEKEEEEKLKMLGVKEYLVKAMNTPEKVVEVIKRNLPS